MNKLIVCTVLALGLIALDQQAQAQVQVYPNQVYQGSSTRQQIVPGQQRYIQGQQATPAPQYYNVTLNDEQKAKPSTGASFFDMGKGVGVRSVYTNSPAQKAGINSGDLITKANGQAVTSAAALNAMIEGAGAGSTVKLTKRTSAGKTSDVECSLMTVGQILEASTVPEAGVFDSAVAQAQVNLKRMENEIRNSEAELQDLKKRYGALQKQIGDLKAKAEKARVEEIARRKAEADRRAAEIKAAAERAAKAAEGN